ncbi:MAG: hypothetical protein KDD42_04280, partial [Bdellovibrionales bacterium]|nr:hypothetical protein [Bdellovibrionales bacterium]
RKNQCSVIDCGDVEGVIKRIAYFFANPAAANLVDSIDQYPGLSSWKAFRDNCMSVYSVFTETVPWIRSATLSKLPCRSLSEKQDVWLVQKLRREATCDHSLVIEPNAWMKCFGVEDDPQVKEINTQILEHAGELERVAREKRRINRQKIKGAHRLKREGITLDYFPTKQERRIFVYAADQEIRKVMISAYREFCQMCRVCYERWRLGELLCVWPPGALFPAPPVLVNHFDT